jgi:toxin FitB
VILVDSNVWRQTENPGGDPAVKDWLRNHERELALSSVVLAEMYFGVALMPEGKRKASIAQWLDQLASMFEGSIVPFDQDCAIAFGTIAAATKAAGYAPSTIDIQLAAQAVAHDAAIATRNVKDFVHTGVTLINPWTD